MSKKKLLSLAVVAIMIAILSFGTLAWFTDSDSVTNDFGVAGGGNNNPDEIFSIDVMEQVDKDGDGDYDMNDVIIGDNKDPNPVHEFTYENILPGDMLYKHPSARNTGAYEQWVRMKVTFDNANHWVALMQKYGYTDMTDMLYMRDKTTKLVDATNWIFAPGETTVENDQVTYVFYYNTKLQPLADPNNTGAAESNAIFFSWVKIPQQFTQADMAPFTNGDFRMVVAGEAIQVKNIDADTAQEAFAIIKNRNTNN